MRYMNLYKQSKRRFSKKCPNLFYYSTHSLPNIYYNFIIIGRSSIYYVNHIIFSVFIHSKFIDLPIKLQENCNLRHFCIMNKFLFMMIYFYKLLTTLSYTHTLTYTFIYFIGITCIKTKNFLLGRKKSFSIRGRAPSYFHCRSVDRK